MKDYSTYTRPLGAFVGAALGGGLLHLYFGMHWASGVLIGLFVGALLSDIVGLCRGLYDFGVWAKNEPNFGRFVRGYFAVCAAFGFTLYAWGTALALLNMSDQASFGSFAELVAYTFSGEAPYWLAGFVAILSLIISVAITAGYTMEYGTSTDAQLKARLDRLPAVAAWKAFVCNPLVAPFALVVWTVLQVPFMLRWTRGFAMACGFFSVKVFAKVNSTSVSAAFVGVLVGSGVGLWLGSKWQVAAVVGLVVCEAFYLISSRLYDWAETKIVAMNIRVRDRDGIKYHFAGAPKQ